MGGQYQLVMEYVDGKNALAWVGSLGEPLSVASAASLGVQLLSALEHAHEKGYVHRDIKPSNLLVMGNHQHPKLKLSDFGLAKSFRDNAGFAGLTHQGDIGGSSGFISPDHIRDFREAKEPADIYSVGATLYYLMSGQFPFFGFDPNRADSYAMILEHPAVPLRAHRPDVPEVFDRIIRKALEKQATGAGSRPPRCRRLSSFSSGRVDRTAPRRRVAHVGSIRHSRHRRSWVDRRVGRAGACARGLATRVVGIGRDEGRLAEANRLGVIDEGTTDLIQGVAEADVVVVCTPVDRIAADVLAAAGRRGPTR